MFNNNIVIYDVFFQHAEPFSPPNDIKISNIGRTHLTFNWSCVATSESCNVIIYNINASNCGICPNSTTSNAVTCSSIPVDGSTCTFSIDTEVCNNITGQGSNIVIVSPKGICKTFKNYLCWCRNIIIIAISYSA